VKMGYAVPHSCSRIVTIVCSFAVIVTALISCAPQTYWGFPAGRTQTDFRVDEAQCRALGAAFEPCLSSRGYYQISQAEFIQRQHAVVAALEAARRPRNIVAYDLTNGDLVVGKARGTPGAKTASIDVSSLSTGLSCTGYAEMTKIVPGGKGSTGTTELLCKDGRKIRGDFVYESPSAGFGRGVDSLSHAYLFKFGHFEIDEQKLRSEFRAMQERKETKDVNHTL
jgi:hypothetical protein